MQLLAAESVDHVRAHTSVPLWVAWPLPAGWMVTGLGYAGDDRSGTRATLLACSGPAPLEGGAADLILIAEEPGVGLGARYAGLPGPDPGIGFDREAAHAKVEADGHPTALWALEAPGDCAAFCGEAKARWLWAIVWPATAGVLLYEDLVLTDLRERCPDLPFGSMTPRISGEPPGR